MSKLETRFADATRAFWSSRGHQQESQANRGQSDRGARGAVTGGRHLDAIEALVVEEMLSAGVPPSAIHTRATVELPGYFRPEKKWDLLVVHDDQLFCAFEFKSQAGPSFGNNFNNRAEEAIGSATDLWTAYREGRLGNMIRPRLGYFFLLEDCPAVHRPVAVNAPHFMVDPEFMSASYSKRYELLCRRLVRERLHDAACLTLSSRDASQPPTHPADDLAFPHFLGEALSSVRSWVQGFSPSR